MNNLPFIHSIPFPSSPHNDGHLHVQLHVHGSALCRAHDLHHVNARGVRHDDGDHHDDDDALPYVHILSGWNPFRY